MTPRRRARRPPVRDTLHWCSQGSSPERIAGVWARTQGRGQARKRAIVPTDNAMSARESSTLKGSVTTHMPFWVSRGLKAPTRHGPISRWRRLRPQKVRTSLCICRSAESRWTAAEGRPGQPVPEVPRPRLPLDSQRSRARHPGRLPLPAAPVYLAAHSDDRAGGCVHAGGAERQSDGGRREDTEFALRILRDVEHRPRPGAGAIFVRPERRPASSLAGGVYRFRPRVRPAHVPRPRRSVVFGDRGAVRRERRNILWIALQNMDRRHHRGDRCRTHLGILGGAGVVWRARRPKSTDSLFRLRRFHRRQVACRRGPSCIPARP